jgi:hypothetical protein
VHPDCQAAMVNVEDRDRSWTLIKKAHSNWRDGDDSESLAFKLRNYEFADSDVVQVDAKLL